MIRYKKSPAWHLTCLFLLFPFFTQAQLFANNERKPETPPPNTRPEHTWQNILSYTISVAPDYNRKSITGTNVIEFMTLQPGSSLFLDLDERMRITSVTWKDAKLEFKREGDGYLVQFPQQIPKEKIVQIKVEFEGQPQEAVDAPNDNG